MVAGIAACGVEAWRDSRGRDRRGALVRLGARNGRRAANRLGSTTKSWQRQGRQLRRPLLGHQRDDAEAEQGRQPQQGETAGAQSFGDTVAGDAGSEKVLAPLFEPGFHLFE